MDSRLDQLTAVQRMDAFLKFSNRPRAFGGPFLALLVLVVSLQSFSRRQFGESFSRLPGDLGDMRLVLYILEHGHQYLTGQQADYWDARFFGSARESDRLSI